jgi:hypothetical protein
MTTDGKNSSQVLTSWKEIASHLGKGVRTVQRWERELGLPVRRPSNSRHIIVAVPSELDEWVLNLQRAGSKHACNCSEELAQTRQILGALRNEVARLEAKVKEMQDSGIAPSTPIDISSGRPLSTGPEARRMVSTRR